MRASARRHVAMASSRSMGPAATRAGSDRPMVELEGAVAPRRQRRVEHVERVERLDAGEQEVLREAVERAAREAAGVDRPALLDERAELLVDRHVAQERLVADLGEAAGAGGHQDAGPVEDEVRLEPLAHQARGRQQVDETDRSLVRDRVHERVGGLALLGLDVGEELLLGVEELGARRCVGEVGLGHNALPSGRWDPRRAGRGSFRIANAFLTKAERASQANTVWIPPVGRRPAPRRSTGYVHHTKQNGLTRPFRMVHIPHRKVDEHATLLRLGDRADRLQHRRQGRQGPGRARLVAPAARPPRRPLPRLDPQDREERHDADDHEPHEGRRRARQERRLVHRGVRRAAAGDGRPARRAHAAAHLQGGARPQQHLRALRAVLRRGRGGRRRAVGRQRPAADDPPRRGARAADRGHDALHDRRGRLRPRGGRLDPLPHRLSALVGQPLGPPGAGDLARDPQLVDGSGAVRIVIAFGGNALIREHERGTWTEQTAHALEAAAAIARVARAHQVVLTHGNGPQVGALALQQAGGEPDAPALPFDVLDAMTQGEIGYLLQQALAAVDPSLPTATILTRVRVNPDDPALSDAPTKPIGPFYDEATARRLAAERGWHVAPDAGRGWRRMMASPRPVEILEEREIRVLAAAGVVVIAAGGGSIPVVYRAGRLAGIDAVIDKDRCAAELATATGADLLVLVTGVPRAALGFGTTAQRGIVRLTVSDALRHLDAGEFPAGSMGPKVEGAARFVGGGGRAVITDVAHVAAALDGAEGTWIVPDAEGPSALEPAALAV